MEITILIENKHGDKEDLQIEHGLSIHIEVDGKNILFDTGQSGDFIENANSLGIDLKKLDHVIISHGHFDHSGGFEKLIKEINPNISLYVGKDFFNEKYGLSQDGSYDYRGNPFDEKFLEANKIPTKYINENMINITDNLLLFTNFIRNKEFENSNGNMYIKSKGNYVKDLFLDEMSIGIKTDKGLVVLVGCSHVGIVNILDTIIRRTKMKIHALIGGTHLVEEDDEKINKIIEFLKENNIEIIGACHCTGKHGETMINQQLEDYVINSNTGDAIKFY